jgi:hypothetical protein
MRNWPIIAIYFSGFEPATLHNYKSQVDLKSVTFNLGIKKNILAKLQEE